MKSGQRARRFAARHRVLALALVLTAALGLASCAASARSAQTGAVLPTVADAPLTSSSTSATTSTALAMTTSGPAPTTAPRTVPPGPSSATGADPLDNPDGLRGGLGVVPAERRAEALALIAQVRVAGRGAKTGYDRDLFGSAWTDAATAVPYARNGCDTRNDVLRRDLADVTLKPGSNGCVALTGTLADPYTNHAIAFTRAHAAAVQIDHVMPLSYDWQLGAAYWSAERREQIANDPLNLLAVDGPTNASKRDSGPASWLPPNKAIRCAYAVRWAQVSRKYDLAVTAADKTMMARQCTGTPPLTEPLRPPAPTTTRAPVAVTPSGGSAYYANCDAARAARVAPLHAGDPGYRARLDGDHDGVACE